MSNGAFKENVKDRKAGMVYRVWDFVCAYSNNKIWGKEILDNNHGSYKASLSQLRLLQLCPEQADLSPVKLIK